MILPSNSTVTDVKPNNKTVIDQKPNNRLVNDPMTIYYETKTINVGNPIGLLLALTYPNTFTFQGVRL